MKSQIKTLQKYSQLTEEFIIAQSEIIDCSEFTNSIERYIHFSDEFFSKFQDKINWKNITPKHKLTTEFVHKHQNKLGFIAWYNESNQLHRDNDEPAVIWANGDKRWYQNGQLHRDNDEPAVIDANGNKYWYQNGFRHRDNDEPAVICANGTKYWYQYGELHRDNNQPAVIDANGTKYWHQNGELHRDNDLPTVIHAK